MILKKLNTLNYDKKIYKKKEKQTKYTELMNYITSAPKGASKCNFRPCEAIMTDDPTNQSTNPTTDQRALLSIGKFPKTIFHRVVSHWRITQMALI